MNDMNDMNGAHDITYTVQNHIATITLQRSHVGNAFSERMMRAWCDIFSEIDQNEDIRCIIVKSNLPNAFTFGGDIKEEQHLSGKSAYQFSRLGQSCAQALRNCRQPVIFSLHGYCLGAGLEFLLSADLIVASDTLKLGIPTIQLGEIPGFGGIGLLGKRIGYANALDLLWTGKTIDAKEALRLGLVQYVVPQEDLTEKTIMLAQRIIAYAPLAVQKMKQVLHHAYQVSLEEQMLYESDCFVEICGTQDRAAAISAFLNKKPLPPFYGK